ncbi:hypothetical protein RAS1_43590 [Phycisphaerae bacterium RAS1]|nr:hypothetical protein RAS1_43590 [Phycisphaerae bacterium RAS1]
MPLLNVIHVTHEAVYKVGGIGTVLEGLINSRPYRDQVGRTVLVCPLFYPEKPSRLGAGAIVEYSPLDQIYGSPYADAFRRIESDWNVRLVYGRKPIEDVPSARRSMCEVLLVDLRGIHSGPLNYVKGQLWERYGLSSNRYEHIWEFEQYVQLAGPAAAALRAMRLSSAGEPAAVLAHEFMGVPTALTLTMQEPRAWRSLFHAHEVAPVRRIVEAAPGHDVMFYRAMELARANGLYLEQVFGPQHDYFKHAVVEAASFCDRTLAVGHLVARELEFFGRKFDSAQVALAFNGVPAGKITVEEKHTSREHLQNYAESLLGWRPDYTFTHVTRFVRSKALWRDLDVLAALDPLLGQRGQSAVLLVLSTELPRRSPEDIRRMEEEYDWPLAHREGLPDLTAGETDFFRQVEVFNTRARNVKVIFINQWGFSRDTCGLRVPPEVEFQDFRRGSDAEFGLSLYEPFGISPLEPLTFGSVCVVSTSCGCAGFLARVVGEKPVANVLLADYLHNGLAIESVQEAIRIDAPARRKLERELAPKIAEGLLARLPTSDEQRGKLIRSGYELAKKMSWDAVAERFVFPALREACAQRRVLSMA